MREKTDITNNHTQEKKLAVCVPYRNREGHLETFVPFMSNYLKEKGIDHKFFICHQADNKEFNRGKIKNIAFDIAKKEGFDYFAFHDIDLIPEDDECDYSYPDKYPVHITTQIDKFDYKLPYAENFGGCVLFTKEQFELVNGYSNEYWGWGAEDDDLFWRCRQKQLTNVQYLDNSMTNTKIIYFNGRNSGIKIPASQSLKALTNNSFSISMLVKTEYSSKIPHHLQSDKDSQYINIPLLSRGGADYLVYSNTGSYNAIVTNKLDIVYESWFKRYKYLWTYLTLDVDMDKKIIRFYLNGIPAESDILFSFGENNNIGKITGTNAEKLLENPLFDFEDDPYFIGSRNTPFMNLFFNKQLTHNYFKGAIARVVFWNRSRSSDEIINEIVNNNINSKDKSIILLYAFNNTSHGWVRDSSTYGNNGKLFGCEIRKENIGKIVKSDLPFRRSGRIKSLPHIEEGYTIESDKSELIKKNEKKLITQVQEGFIDTCKCGLNNLTYEIIGSKVIYDDHIMVDVKC